MTEFYYCVSDCLIALRQLQFDSDLYSSGTLLRQTVRRLPERYANKWYEFAEQIWDRTGEEINLMHFETMVAEADACSAGSRESPAAADKKAA